MRVRLIRPMLIELRRLDTETTKATGGYDPDFGAVRVTREPSQPGQPDKRVSLRKEKPPILVHGQWEDATQNALRMFAAGNSPEFKVTVTFDFHELQSRGLVDPRTGIPLINVNDRLSAVYSPTTRKPVMLVRPPGLYAVEVRAGNVALNAQVGIVIVRFNDRALSEAPA